MESRKTDGTPKTVDSVLTLLTGPDCKPLEPSHADRARAAIEKLGATSSNADWLSHGLACDIPFQQVSPDQAQAAVELALEGESIDIVAQASDTRRKKLLIADMDSTIVTGETLDDLADFADLKTDVSAITARAMNGELDFNEALRERVSLLKGLKEDYLEQTYKAVVLTPGAKDLLKTMRRNGAKAALVSGGFTYFTEKIAKRLGFHHQSGNTLEIKQGKLTGKVIEPIVNRENKRETLIKLAAEYQIPLSDTMAVGDGANDLPMLMVAGMGIAYRAKPIVQEQARFGLNYANLRGLLYIQGYRDSHIDN